MGRELTPVPAAGGRKERGHLGSVLLLLNKSVGSCPQPGAEPAWGALPEAVLGAGAAAGAVQGGLGWDGPAGR